MYGGSLPPLLHHLPIHPSFLILSPPLEERTLRERGGDAPGKKEIHLLPGTEKKDPLDWK